MWNDRIAFAWVRCKNLHNKVSYDSDRKLMMIWEERKIFLMLFAAIVFLRKTNNSTMQILQYILWLISNYKETCKLSFWWTKSFKLFLDLLKSVFSYPLLIHLKRNYKNDLVFTYRSVAQLIQSSKYMDTLLIRNLKY